MEFRKQTARSSYVRELAAMLHFLKRMRRLAATLVQETTLLELGKPAALELTLAHLKYGRLGWFGCQRGRAAHRVDAPPFTLSSESMSQSVVAALPT